MEAEKIPSYSTLDYTFHVVGAVVSVVLLIKIVPALIRLIKLHWPLTCSKTDLVAMYGKWAVISGGSDGIGKGYAMELAQRGMNIFILSNRENDIVLEIKKKFPEVEVRYLDVDFSRPDVYGRIEKELMLLDDIGILVNNVGMAQPKGQPLVEQDWDFFKNIINVNMTAMVCLTQMVLKDMIQKNRGLIVNMSSLSSICPLPYGAMYSSSKGFVDNFSVCLATELNETDVRVKCIQPCFVNTGMLKELRYLTTFLRTPLLKCAFPDGSQFAAAVVQTFGDATPVIYSGYFPHDVLAVLLPNGLLDKESLCTCFKVFLRWLGEI